MGKVKELMMTIQEATWDAIEKNPAVEFDALVKEVAVTVGHPETLVAPIVEGEYLAYKQEYGKNDGWDGYGAEEAEYEDA